MPHGDLSDKAGFGFAVVGLASLVMPSLWFTGVGPIEPMFEGDATPATLAMIRCVPSSAEVASARRRSSFKALCSLQHSMLEVWGARSQAKPSRRAPDALTRRPQLTLHAARGRGVLQAGRRHVSVQLHVSLLCALEHDQRPWERVHDVRRRRDVCRPGALARRLLVRAASVVPPRQCVPMPNATCRSKRPRNTHLSLLGNMKPGFRHQISACGMSESGESDPTPSR